MTLARRSLLALTLAACVPAARRKTRPVREAKPPIVVIGAGLSGLVVAHRLMSQGRDVRVVEARARPGGRILTLRHGFIGEQFAEAGAKHVVGDPDLLTLLDELGIEREEAVRTDGLRRVRHVNGTRQIVTEDAPEATELSAGERALVGWNRMTMYFPELGDPREQRWPPPALRAHDGLTAAAYLRSRGASSAYISGMQFPVGEGLETMSALSLMRIIAWIQVERTLPRGGRIAGGTSRLPEALATRLGERVSYRARVLRIEQHDGMVRLAVDTDGTVTEMRADRVVCTVPTAVCRDIVFAPALSAAKREAMRKIQNTSVVRVFAQVSDRVWLREGVGPRADTDLEIGPIGHATDAQPGEPAILSTYLTGASARAACEHEAAEREKRTVDAFDRVHPGTRDHVVATASKCWDSDPFARGAYPWYRENQLTTLHPHLARAEGRVHFAGDNTSRRPGFMHGALASANRVLRELDAS